MPLENDGSGPALTAMRDEAQAKAQEEKDLAEKLKKEHEEMIKAQIAKHREFMHNKMPMHRGDQGVLEKVAYQTGMSAEGQVGEILAILIGNALMALFGTHYWIQVAVYEDAKAKGIAYEKRADDTYPPIFQIVNGKPIGDPLKSEAITRDLIRQNGLVPEPSYEESWVNAMDTYQAWMMGPSTLTPEQQRRTLMVAGDVHRSENRSDAQHQYDAFMANQPKPAPAPRK